MMMKRKKEELLNKIYNLHPPVNIPQSISNSPLGYELQQMIQNAIKWHTQEIARIIVEDLYTQEDFEEDLGLK
jgi:hypothetical protein